MAPDPSAPACIGDDHDVGLRGGLAHERLGDADLLESRRPAVGREAEQRDAQAARRMIVICPGRPVQRRPALLARSPWSADRPGRSRRRGCWRGSSRRSPRRHELAKPAEPGTRSSWGSPRTSCRAAPRASPRGSRRPGRPSAAARRRAPSRPGPNSGAYRTRREHGVADPRDRDALAEAGRRWLRRKPSSWRTPSRRRGVPGDETVPSIVGTGRAGGSSSPEASVAAAQMPTRRRRSAGRPRSPACGAPGGGAAPRAGRGARRRSRRSSARAGRRPPARPRSGSRPAPRERLGRRRARTARPRARGRRATRPRCPRSSRRVAPRPQPRRAPRAPGAPVPAGARRSPTAARVPRRPPRAARGRPRSGGRRSAARAAGRPIRAPSAR